MNPLSNVEGIRRMNQRELEIGLVGKPTSWHQQYKDSAWIFIGGLPYDLTEGDIICVFSQYGEIVNINLVRDKKTGKSKGYCFLCFEDQRSTILTVDNLNGIKILGRTLRVDHVHDYKMPKEHDDEDEETKKLRTEGCAPKMESSEEEEVSIIPLKKTKKEKKSKKKEKKEKKKKKVKSSSESSSSDEKEKTKVRTEHKDRGRESYNDSRDKEGDRYKSAAGHKRTDEDFQNKKPRSQSRSRERDEYRRRRDRDSPNHKGRDRDRESERNGNRDRYERDDRAKERHNDQIRDRSRDRHKTDNR